MSPLLILALLVVGIVVWQLGRSRAKPRPECNWTATGKGTQSLAEFYCETCKVTAYGMGGTPPRDCKRNLKGSL